MRKLISSFPHLLFSLAFVTAMTLVAACGDTFEGSDNGKFDGFWLLTDVDTLETGTSENVREKMIFWSVQGNLIQMSVNPEDVRISEKEMPTIYYYFDLLGDSLKLQTNHSPVAGYRAVSDYMASMSDVEGYGLCRLDEEFKVVNISKNNMILQSEWLRLYFTKY